MAIALGHQPIKYYICTGLDPTKDFKKPVKIYGIVEIGSLAFNIFVAAKIYLFKKGLSKKATCLRGCVAAWQCGPN